MGTYTGSTTWAKLARREALGAEMAKLAGALVPRLADVPLPTGTAALLYSLGVSADAYAALK